VARIQTNPPTVTGANRGVGLGLVLELAKRPDVRIFATARDPSRAADLQAAAAKYPITVLSWRADHEDDSKALVDKVKEVTDRVDVVIANAGESSHCITRPSPSTVHVQADPLRQDIDGSEGSTSTSTIISLLTGVFSHPDPVLKTPLQNFIYDFTVNAGGPLHLLQAIYPLLQASTLPCGAVWAPISSCLGSIAESPNVPALAYGASKAALNYTSKRLAVENEDIKVLIIQ
jgi:NAD(P)-dependent dehydrogenase (short-subunit alcohol dehydrogenase family)